MTERFYFHVRSIDDVALDYEGQNFNDLAAARGEAINTARSMLAEQVLSGRADLRQQIDIADRDGQVLDSVTFAQAVIICPTEPSSSSAMH